MALTEKHRNTIYQYLAPAWGDDVTQAFLSQFPAREGEEPITRDYLRAELAELRADLRAEMADLGRQLRAETAELRTEVSEQGNELRAEMAAIRAELNRQGSRLAGLVIGVSGVLTAVIALS